MTFAQRTIGALKLDAMTFEEVAADQRANLQAFAVVVVASLAAGIGVGMQAGIFGLLREMLAALAGWVMWAAVTFVIGTKVFPEPQTRSDMGELLRVIGFSYAPEVFNVLAFVPVVGTVIGVIVAFWLLAATVIAVRQALDYRSTLRAFVVVLFGWVFFVVIQEVL